MPRIQHLPSSIYLTVNAQQVHKHVDSWASTHASVCDTCWNVRFRQLTILGPNSTCLGPKTGHSKARQQCQQGFMPGSFRYIRLPMFKCNKESIFVLRTQTNVFFSLSFALLCDPSFERTHHRERHWSISLSTRTSSPFHDTLELPRSLKTLWHQP